MRWILPLAALALLAGCQRAPGAKSPSATSAQAVSLAELKSDAAALAARGEYEQAADKYGLAIERDPADVAVRYLFGVVLSQLDRRPETSEQFRFVVSRGGPDSEEVAIARRWLAQHGVEAPRQAGATSGQDTEAAATAPTIARVKGRTEWTGIDPAARRLTVRIELGRDGEPRGPRTRLRHFVFGQPYEFAAVLPGRYRLTAMVEGVTLWDQVVTVEAGKDVVLDLVTTNSFAPGDAARAFGTGEVSPRASR